MELIPVAEHYNKWDREDTRDMPTMVILLCPSSEKVLKSFEKPVTF